MKLLKKIIKKLIPERFHLDLQMLRLYLKQDDLFYELSERREFMRKAFRLISFNGITGDYLEFGCCSGNTFRLAYEESRKANLDCKLWAFDSFKGLPASADRKDEHPKWKEGSMSISVDEFKKICKDNKIADSVYEIVPGFYKDSIGEAGAKKPALPDDIALAYIDCDMYSSTKTVLEFIAKRLKHGMVIAFDDYYCFSSTGMSGERRAYLELVGLEQRFNFLPYLNFGWHGMSFIVEERII